MIRLERMALALLLTTAGCATEDVPEADAEEIVEATTSEESGDSIQVGGSFSSLYHNNCTAQQSKRLAQVAARASRLVDIAKLALRQPEYGGLVEHWFGREAASNPTLVEHVLASVRTRLGTGNYGYDCDHAHVSCFDGQGGEFFARAQGRDTVRLCAPFWRSTDNARTDSASGTLVHELSHFHGTLDLRYGTSGARWLTINEPWNAVNNADNYQYFVEAFQPLVPYP